MKYIQHQIKDILYPDTSLYQILKLPHHCHLPFTLVQIQLSGNARSCSRVDCQHELITCSENPAQLFSLLHALCRQFLFQGCCYTIAGSVIILVVKEKEKKNKTILREELMQGDAEYFGGWSVGGCHTFYKHTHLYWLYILGKVIFSLISSKIQAQTHVI